MAAVSSGSTHAATLDLSGSVALVTGGGRGIGRTFAETLARTGAAVAITGRTADALTEAVATIERSGGRALALPFDVTDAPAISRAVAEVERQWGSIDLLINNAGEWGPIAPVWEVDPEAWWRTMEIHVRGSFLCARAVLPGMIARGRGRIVTIVSHAGVHRWPTCSAYAVSKAAAIKLTENMAVEVRRHGVSVFAVNPGIVTIGLTDQAMTMTGAPESAAGRAAAWIRQQVAAGRAVPPERGAELIVALATGRADALTGRYLSVDDDLATLVARAAQIQQDDLYTLKLQSLAAPTGDAPAVATRASAVRHWFAGWWRR